MRSIDVSQYLKYPTQPRAQAYVKNITLNCVRLAKNNNSSAIALGLAKPDLVAGRNATGVF